MPFDEARQFIEDQCRQRGKDLREGRRLKWSTSEASKLPDMLKKFDRKSEHGEWKGIHKQKAPDMNQLMGVSGRIAWLCSCARDLRLQFMAGASDKLRTSVAHSRFEVAYLEWKEKTMRRLKELMQERKKKL